MAGRQTDNSVRVGSFDLGDGLKLDDWMARRNAQVAQKGQAELAGRQAWANSIRPGISVDASQPSQIRAAGMSALSGQPARTNLSHGYNPNEPRDERGRYPKGLSEYFATPYEGGGHHFLPKRTELPAWLGGGPVPPVVSDSLLFLLKPRNVSTGDFLERHFQVDPHYKGGNIPARFGGGGWSGRDLGWQKHDRLGRLWYGSPAPLKAVAGAGVVGAGAAVDQGWNGEGPP